MVCRTRRCRQRPRPAPHCWPGPSPTPPPGGACRSQTTSPALASICPSAPPPPGWPPADLTHPAPSLQPHYRAFTATTDRSAPVPRTGTLPLAVSAACGPPSRSRGNLPRPSLSGRQVLLFHASACGELTPPLHRAPPGQHPGRLLTHSAHNPRLHPGGSARPRFRCHRSPFRCVISGSLTFVFIAAHLTAHSGLFRNAHHHGS